MGSKKLIIIMIVIVLVLIIGLGTVIVLVAKKNKEEKNNRDAVLTRINSDSNEEIKISELDETNETSENETEIEKETKDLEIATFNMQFESYTNKDISAEDVKNLVKLIETNNMANEEHNVRLDTSISSVTVSKKYNAEALKDEKGYIDTIKLTESQGSEQQNTNESDIDKARFNSKFIAYDESGEISGLKIRELINEVISNNSQNTAHTIDVQTSTVSEVNDEEKYSILLKYDDNGWINQIFIEKKD